MTLSHVAVAPTDGGRRPGYWRDRLIAVGGLELRDDFRGAMDVSAPVAQRIHDFLAGNYPNAVCDRCICEALDFYSNAQAALITGALGTTSDFDRRHGQCALCKNERIVVRANRAADVGIGAAFACTRCAALSVAIAGNRLPRTAQSCWV
jgi:hypothetical protein